MAGTRSVGLLIMTEVPDMGLCAVLQRRGEYNFEKNRPESYPGACQVTVHGKVKDGEDEKKALYREAREELGDRFVESMLKIYYSDVAVGMPLISATNTAKTFVIKLPYEMILRIELHVSSGGLLLVKEDGVKIIRPLNLSDEHRRVTDLAMFEDEILAVKRAFLNF